MLEKKGVETLRSKSNIKMNLKLKSKDQSSA